MSSKQEIETWVAALSYYDEKDFDNAVASFGEIADTAKFRVNIGLIYATLGQHLKANDWFSQAIELDDFLGIAYFQRGVSNFLMSEFEDAIEDFEGAIKTLREFSSIDYTQLGLKFLLHRCEVLFNIGLSYIRLDLLKEGMRYLRDALRCSHDAAKSVIEDAIACGAEGYNVFSIPVGVLYRPRQNKVDNLLPKDWLGKPKLVAAAMPTSEGPSSFSPVGRVPQAPTGIGRERQQSAPPTNRLGGELFPFTPPLENGGGAKTANSIGESMMGRGTSTRRSAPKPLNLVSPNGKTIRSQLPGNTVDKPQAAEPERGRIDIYAGQTVQPSSSRQPGAPSHQQSNSYNQPGHGYTSSSNDTSAYAASNGAFSPSGIDQESLSSVSHRASRSFSDRPPKGTGSRQPAYSRQEQRRESNYSYRDRRTSRQPQGRASDAPIRRPSVQGDYGDSEEFDSEEYDDDDDLDDEYIVEPTDVNRADLYSPNGSSRRGTGSGGGYSGPRRRSTATSLRQQPQLICVVLNIGDRAHELHLPRTQRLEELCDTFYKRFSLQQGTYELFKLKAINGRVREVTIANQYDLTAALSGNIPEEGIEFTVRGAR